MMIVYSFVQNGIKGSDEKTNGHFGDGGFFNFFVFCNDFRRGPAEKKGELKAVLVLDQRRGDMAVIDQMCDGILRAEKELQVKIKILESRDATEYEDNIRAMVA